jgi:hypothetical protein
MTAILAPNWALSAQAIDVEESPILQARPGIHLRVLPGMALGLPIAPLKVWRFSPGQIGRVARRLDRVAWTGPDGRPLPQEFELADAGTATAWLPTVPGSPVIWAGVVMEAEDEKARLEALVSGLHGAGAVASTTRNPWQVAATGIDRLVLSGEGLVKQVWLVWAPPPPEKLEERPPLALPIPRGRRYEGIPDALAEAERRVLEGAPRRVGLHDQPGAEDPESCREAGEGEELERVEFLWGAQVGEMVTAVVESEVPPRRLRLQPRPLEGPVVPGGATLQLPPLAGTMQAALDPGVGRFLGLATRDEKPPESEAADLVIYYVQGAWAYEIETAMRPLQALPEIAAPVLPTVARPEWVEAEGIPVVDFWTVAAVVIGTENSPPRAPAVTAAEDLGWTAEPPPAATCRVVLGLDGLCPGAAVALAREPKPTPLNPRLADLPGGGPNRAVPIVCGVPAANDVAPGATGPGQGEVHDRRAPAEGARYRVAQADWFGRWSGWSEGKIGPGIRPPAPIPVLDATFVPPPSPGGEGTLEVRCQQPRDVGLAPGTLPLVALRVRAKVDDGPPRTVEVAADRGGVPEGQDSPPLIATIKVPGLGPAEKRALSARGCWLHDEEEEPGEASWSPPAGALASDPRAPLALQLPNTLFYASRPDALGRSRVRLRWQAERPPTEYRVYHSDETTLLRHLAVLRDNPAKFGQSRADEAKATLQELAQQQGGPDRAAVFQRHNRLLDRSCFELVTARPLRRSGDDEWLSHEHELSGSLAVLAFYRVVPVSALGAEAKFTDCTLLPRGVPNTPAPPAPSLSAEIDPADPARVRLEVSVPAGASAPVALRLRRSRKGGEDPLAMPIVADATPGSWEPAELFDAGAGPWGGPVRFVPWSTYTWRAEVQGGQEPGSEVPGAWGKPSAPVSLRIVPPGPPAAPAPGTATPKAIGVSVGFSAPEPLDGGSAGSFAIELYRRLPSGPQMPGAKSGPVGEFDPAAIRQADGSYLAFDPAQPPQGTVYLVQIVDPLGRRGPRTEVATL